MSLTMEIRHALELGEYTDPAQVRKLLKSGKFSGAEFKDALWTAILTAFPCPKEGGLPGSLTAAKQKVWGQLSVEHPAQSEHEIIESYCRTANLCMQCECKKKVIDFFVGIGSGSADTVRHRLTTWLTGKVSRLERLTYIQLCFALNLRVYPSAKQLTDEEKSRDANRFLALCCKQPPLYTARPEEAVYYFCLANPGQRDNKENWLYAQELIRRSAEYKAEKTEDDLYTMYAASAVESIKEEQQLLSFIAGNHFGEHELYSTAKENCRLLYEQFDISETVTRSAEYGEKTADSRKKPIRKKDAQRVLDALSAFDDTGELGEDIIEALERYSFGDILYSSGRLDELLEGESRPDRTLLLLTMLAQNCGMEYDPVSNTLGESDDLTDIPSFNEYFRRLSALLRNMSMAPLYPRWRTDFVVLYAYHLLQKDILGDKEADSMSGYIVKALRLIMEEK